MLAHFLKGSKKYFVLAVFFTCGLSFIELINPKVIGITIDGLLNDPEYYKGLLPYIALFVVGVALLGALFRYMFGLMNSKGAEKLTKNMRNELYEHIEYLPYSWHGENKTGDIIQRCTSDVDTIKKFLSEDLTTLLRTIVMIVFALIFMFNISVPMAFVSLAFIPVVVGYSLIFHKQIGEAFFKIDTEEGVLSTIAQENLTGVRVVRAFGREAYERERFMSQNEKYTGMWVNMMKILSRFWSTVDLISGLQIVTVLSVGSYFCVCRGLSAGSFVSFVSYNAMLSWPVRNLGRVIADMSKAGISIDRIRYIMESEPEKDIEGALSFPQNKDIDFENVSYSFGDDEALVLKNINLHIKEGSTLGILGKTGSGKSTLAQLLLRLYELPPENGTIKIGGEDIRNLRKDDIRENIGLVLQEPYLYSRTLGENIAMALPPEMDEKVKEGRVKEAISVSCLEGTIDKFTEGLDTKVGERGVTLSGGQKQRTAIAACVARHTPVLIFDDSMSAVDLKTDEKIRHAIKDNKNDTTVILISHRINTLMLADNIIVLDNGRIIEQGSHEELVKKKGFYSKIYELQNAT